MGEKRAVYTYPGEALDVTWDARLCIHVGECTRAHGELFVRGRRPWGEPDRADAEVVAEVVRRCPTGSLAYRRRDGGPAETADADNRITVSNRGPLYARGDLRIEGAPDDMPGVATRAALCRCGRSANKPFCDNAHEESGFDDRGAVGTRGEPLAQGGGPLEVTPLPNGPLVVRGNLTLIAGDGRVAWQGTKAALCRCGGSATKPFCDGAHKRIGFTTD
jgi:CDGSH-type Zn-finger protein/uncharacterized Fe-S cluster protein YjdI